MIRTQQKLEWGDMFSTNPTMCSAAVLAESHRKGNNLGNEGFNVIVSELSSNNNLRTIVILAEVSLGKI